LLLTAHDFFHRGGEGRSTVGGNAGDPVVQNLDVRGGHVFGAAEQILYARLSVLPPVSTVEERTLTRRPTGVGGAGTLRRGRVPRGADSAPSTPGQRVSQPVARVPHR